jgi:hypothetical protein
LSDLYAYFMGLVPSIDSPAVLPATLPVHTAAERSRDKGRGINGGDPAKGRRPFIRAPDLEREVGVVGADLVGAVATAERQTLLILLLVLSRFRPDAREEPRQRHGTLRTVAGSIAYR